MVHLSVLEDVQPISIFVFKRYNQVSIIRGSTPDHTKILIAAFTVINECAVSRNFETFEFAASDEVPYTRHRVGAVGY